MSKALSSEARSWRHMHSVIICSETDDASQNVARHLLKRAPWTQCSDGPAQWTYGNLQLLVLNLGYEVLRKSDIENHGDVSWEQYLRIRRVLRRYGVTFDGVSIQVSASLRDSLAAHAMSLDYFEFKHLELNPAIIKLACAVDIESFKHLIEIEKIVYLERKDGRIVSMFVPAESSSINVTNALLIGCTEILKKRYEVEYSEQKSKLYISARKFNARLARSLG